jgi:hypothetical protein
MGKVVATYLVKVTIREPDEQTSAAELPEPPTNEALAGWIEASVTELTGFSTNATSERTDK